MPGEQRPASCLCLALTLTGQSWVLTAPAEPATTLSASRRQGRRQGQAPQGAPPPPLPLAAACCL